MNPKEFNLAVLVSGRGTNLQAIIDSIERRELEARIAVVVSNVGDAPALERARNHNLATLFLDPKIFTGRKDYEKQLIEELRNRSIDLICLAGFMRILGTDLLEAFRGRIINIHPSLLPAFAGLHPQKQALDHGVKISGCTVHFVDEGVDSGPIILQAAVPVYDHDDEASLAARILAEEHKIYPRAIDLIRADRLTIAGRKVIQKNDA